VIDRVLAQNTTDREAAVTGTDDGGGEALDGA